MNTLLLVFQRCLSKRGFSIPFYTLLNFSALAFGSLLMNQGPSTNWYISLNKAPWTPPGWVFGFAWTLVMGSYVFYMSRLTRKEATRTVGVLFSAQWLLNVFWNDVFFDNKWPMAALGVLFALTLVIFVFVIKFRRVLKWHSLFAVPYLLWLCIALSLNAYIVFNNAR